MLKEREYQQCTRCVMDTSDPDIHFDGNGYCNHCTELLHRINSPAYEEHFSKKNFEALLEKIKSKGRGKKYDCILGLSGGVDSSYLAYLLKGYGLRVLLVHMDNGWDAEESVRNIKAVAGALHFDYDSVVLNWEKFRDIQKAFLKASVIEAETPTDIAIQGALHQKAAEHKVAYILSAGNLATEGILPAYWHYNSKDYKYLSSVQRRFGTLPVRKLLPTFNLWEEVWYKFVKGIRIIYPLNYIRFAKEEAIAILENKIGWRRYGGKHHESRYTKFIQSYLLPEKFGIDYRKATYSSEICFGNKTRAEALQLLQQPLYQQEEVEREKKFIAKKLGLSFDEFEQILALPPKSYKDYPNNQQLLEFFYRTYRKIFTKV